MENLNVEADVKIIDLNDTKSVKLKLSDFKKKVKFGLTLGDQIAWSNSSSDDDIVVKLFTLSLDNNGVWLTPDHDFPCLLNEVDIEDASLLSHGSSIYVGEHDLRFESTVHFTLSDDSGKVTPPPKPRRLFLTRKASFEPKSRTGEDVSLILQDQLDQSNELLSEYDLFEVTPEHEESMIANLNTAQQVASIVTSYVLRQLMLNTEATLSTTDVDTIFRAFEEMDTASSPFLTDFMLAYQTEQRMPVSDSATGHVIDRSIIQLLLNMLMFSLEPVEHNILWLRLLEFFSHITSCFEAFITYRSAAVVMGTMAAHGYCVEVQRYACKILSRLSLYVPSMSEKAAVRECGVELILRAMNLHEKDLPIIHNACTALANVVVVAIACIKETSQSDESDGNELRKDNAFKVLAYVKEKALPQVMSVMGRYPDDAVVQVHGQKISDFFLKKIRNKSNGKNRSQRTRRKVKQKSLHKNYQSTNDLSDYNETNERSLRSYSSMDNLDECSHKQKRSSLKKARSLYDLDDSSSYVTKRVMFSDDTFGGSATSSSDNEATRITEWTDIQSLDRISINNDENTHVNKDNANKKIELSEQNTEGLTDLGTAINPTYAGRSGRAHDVYDNAIDSEVRLQERQQSNLIIPGVESLRKDSEYGVNRTGTVYSTTREDASSAVEPEREKLPASSNHKNLMKKVRKHWYSLVKRKNKTNFDRPGKTNSNKNEGEMVFEKESADNATNAQALSAGGKGNVKMSGATKTISSKMNNNANIVQNDTSLQVQKESPIKLENDLDTHDIINTSEHNTDDEISLLEKASYVMASSSDPNVTSNNEEKSAITSASLTNPQTTTALDKEVAKLERNTKQRMLSASLGDLTVVSAYDFEDIPINEESISNDSVANSTKESAKKKARKPWSVMRRKKSVKTRETGEEKHISNSVENGSLKDAVSCQSLQDEDEKLAAITVAMEGVTTKLGIRKPWNITQRNKSVKVEASEQDRPISKGHQAPSLTGAISCPSLLNYDIMTVTTAATVEDATVSEVGTPRTKRKKWGKLSRPSIKGIISKIQTVGEKGALKRSKSSNQLGGDVNDSDYIAANYVTPSLEKKLSNASNTSEIPCDGHEVNSISTHCLQQSQTNHVIEKTESVFPLSENHQDRVDSSSFTNASSPEIMNDLPSLTENNTTTLARIVDSTAEITTELILTDCIYIEPDVDKMSITSSQNMTNKTDTNCNGAHPEIHCNMKSEPRVTVAETIASVCKDSTPNSDSPQNLVVNNEIKESGMTLTDIIHENGKTDLSLDISKTKFDSDSVNTMLPESNHAIELTDTQTDVRICADSKGFSENDPYYDYFSDGSGEYYTTDAEAGTSRYSNVKSSFKVKGDYLTCMENQILKSSWKMVMTELKIRFASQSKLKYDVTDVEAAIEEFEDLLPCLKHHSDIGDNKTDNSLKLNSKNSSHLETMNCTDSQIIAVGDTCHSEVLQHQLDEAVSCTDSPLPAERCPTEPSSDSKRIDVVKPDSVDIKPIEELGDREIAKERTKVLGNEHTISIITNGEIQNTLSETMVFTAEKDSKLDHSGAIVNGKIDDSIKSEESTCDSLEVEGGDEQFDQILSGHNLIQHTLEFRKLVVDEAYYQWFIDPDEVIKLLSSSVNDPLLAVYATDELSEYVRNEYDVDKSLLEADPSIVVNVLQMVCLSEMAPPIALQLLNKASEFLDCKYDSYHITKACACLQQLIQGPLDTYIKEGWGLFTLKIVHKKTEALLLNQQLDMECRDVVSSLHHVLNKTILQLT